MQENKRVPLFRSSI